MSDLKTILTSLADAFGPTGFEGEVRGLFRKYAGDHAEISYDNLGGIIARHRGAATAPKILLAAHLDEVGLLVRGILPNGCLKVVPLGSWWPPALLAQRMTIRSRKGDLPGVIGAKPPHYMSEDEKTRQPKIGEFYIDVGTNSREETEAMGIMPGDPVVPAVQAASLNNPDRLVGKAFDDRAGCAILLQVLRELDGNHPNQVCGAGTVQEEVGAKGARVISRLVEPDLCLVLEGAPADDFPEAGSIIQGRVGGGPQIRRFDPSMIANQALVDLLVNEARGLQIPYQIAVREGGGTDGSIIQLESGGGVPTAVIGIPVRYAHSHQGIVSLADVEAAVKLVKAVIYKLNADLVNSLKQNPWRLG